MMQPVEISIKRKIRGHGRGWVFTPKHFVGLGSSEAIRFVLHTLNKEGFIRRLAQGIYDYPRQHKTLGTLSPSVEAITQALSEKHGFKVQPSGAYAANLLGLSEQVPGKVVFLTDGPSKKIIAGKMEISLRHTTLKNMHAAGSKEALVIQAFKFMKRKNISTPMLEKTRRFLKGSKRNELERNLKYAPEWIRTLLLKLMEHAA